MKAFFRRTAAGLALTVALSGSLAALSACGAGADSAELVTLNESSIVLRVGEEYTLTAQTEGDVPLVWSSDNEAVATVSQEGKVTAVKAGSAAICAYAEGGSDYCQITVTQQGNVNKDDEEKVDGYLFYEDFDERTSVPGYLRQSLSGGGALSVEEGTLNFKTVGTGTAFATYIFDEPLSGKVVAEARVKVSTTAFSNILFFYRGEAGYDNNDVIACLGMDNGGFKNHNGSGWSAAIMPYATDTWYEIRMELDIGNGRYDLTINGTKCASQTFRKRGDGVEDRIKLLKFGTDKENAGITYDYIRIAEGKSADAPVIEAEASNYVIGVGETLHLDYAVTGRPAPAMQVTTNAPGAVVGADNKSVDFAGVAAGEYTVIVRAENEHGSDERTFTVTVRADKNVLFDSDFDTLPAGMATSAANGTAQVAGGKLVLTTGASGSALSLARYDFGAALTGKVRVDMALVNNSSENTFVNILYFFKSGVTSFDAKNCASALAIEKGNLKYHDGSGWKNICAVTRGETLEFSVLYDYDLGAMTVTLNGNVVLREGSLRNPDFDACVMMVGADKLGLDLSYDHLRVTRVSE